MENILIIIFVMGYLGITLEHTFKIDKLVPALAMMAIMWAVIALAHIPVFEINEVLKELEPHHMEGVLLHHLGKTSEILMFLLGAMTIVEITDHFNGFGAIKKFIRTNKKSTLLWIITILAFVLSAVIDNLTATIVLITILKKILNDPKQRMWYAGMIIIAANAGGAWSPIGDVTTTMLWIGNKVSAGALFKFLIVPSLACFILPNLIAMNMKPFKGGFDMPKDDPKDADASLPMLILGLGAIIFVPIFKTITHLPPYVGMMLSLAVVATVAEIISNRRFKMSTVSGSHNENPGHKALSRIELPSILFFLGILMAVAALESMGTLFRFAGSLNEAIPNTDIVVMLFGVGSAIVDNVPLVAASLGMFSQPMDDPLWHFIAYSAGTGGSMLIIGSAAGVVAMGMERIDFVWYLKNISWLAVVGFVAGCATFIGMGAAGLH